MADREFICNSCGRKLSMKNGILQEDALIVEKEWGYFSRKDLQIHEIVLCEECYDKWVAGWKVPVRIKQKIEVLQDAALEEYRD